MICYQVFALDNDNPKRRSRNNFFDIILLTSGIYVYRRLAVVALGKDAARVDLWSQSGRRDKGCWWYGLFDLLQDF